MCRQYHSQNFFLREGEGAFKSLVSKKKKSVKIIFYKTFQGRAPGCLLATALCVVIKFSEVFFNKANSNIMGYTILKHNNPKD